MPPVPPRELVTTTGVRVIVSDPPTPPESAPEPAPEPAPTIVVRPPEEAVRRHDELMARLVNQYKPFLDRLMERQTDVLPRSREDVAHEVWLVVNKEVWDTKQLPPNVEGYLTDCVRYKVANYRRARARERRRREQADLTPSPAPNPEREAQRVEQYAKVVRYFRSLTPAEQDTFRCLIHEGMTFDQAAEALGRPRGGVVTQMGTIRRKLKDRAEDSERRTKLGAALRSSRPPPRED